MASETRLETRPGGVELFVRGERVALYLHQAPIPGMRTLYAGEQRAVTRASNDRGVSVWFGHSGLEGYVFGEPAGEGTGLYRSFDVVARRGSQSVGMQHTCGCFTPDGRCLLTEVRTLRVQPGPSQGAVLDLHLELRAPDDHSATLVRSERGLLRVQLAPVFVSPSGTVRNSVGDYGLDIGGRSAAWCGCVGVMLAETVGLVILDHPANLAHPPVWNLDETGTLEINPHRWQETVIPAGKSVEFRYRVLIHCGYVDQGWADLRMREFAA